MKGKIRPELAPQGTRIRVGISSCLLGERVRYDGGHKLDTLITHILGRLFEWVPVCPEMEIGLGAPREALRLVGGRNAPPRLVAQHSGLDHTQMMAGWAERRLDEIGGAGLHGFVLKSKSPSCGFEAVRVHAVRSASRRSDRGIFTAAIVRRFPHLPAADEIRLRDAGTRDNFVERVFAHHRWTMFLRSRPGPEDLERYHSSHRLLLMSHGITHYRALGRVVAGATHRRIGGVLREYEERCMEALRVKATRKRHALVLRYVSRNLRRHLDATDLTELDGSIDAYQAGMMPLNAPLTLVRHHLRRHPVDWLSEQTYLNPPGSHADSIIVSAL
ncbi:MAG: DUF1722 domain-containing protein [Acidobacteria bacterium]|nr:DUF1722 domain-containing protein [Acidobacteriota bacterium]